MTNCIYRIECLDEEIKDIYIGSTGDLKERIANHKCCCNNINRPEYNYKLYKFIRNHGGWNNWRIDIELLTTGYDKEIRLEMEQNYIDCLKPSLNSKNAKGLDMEKLKEHNKQYKLDNKEKIKEYAKSDKRKKYAKQYKLDNKEKFNVKSKCPDCGIEMLKYNISRHIRLNHCKGKETQPIINLGDICPPKMLE